MLTVAGDPLRSWRGIGRRGRSAPQRASYFPAHVRTTVHKMLAKAVINCGYVHPNLQLPRRPKRKCSRKWYGLGRSHLWKGPRPPRCAERSIKHPRVTAPVAREMPASLQDGISVYVHFLKARSRGEASTSPENGTKTMLLKAPFGHTSC